MPDEAGPPPTYPVNLVVDGRSCLVVGGGHVAARKVAGLVAAGARVHVIAPRVADEIRATPGVSVDDRPYAAGDVAGHWLVITATGDPAVDRAVAADAGAAGLWVNSADDPAHCSFTLPSVVRRGDLTITVSTGGRSPAMAAWLRRRFEGELGPEYEQLLNLLAAERDAAQAAGRPTEGLDWQRALESGMLDWIRAGEVQRAREYLQACLSSSSG